MYTCDVCSKDHWEPEGLRTIQTRYEDEEVPSSIYTWVVCVKVCAVKVRNEATIVLTDEPFKGVYTEGVGYV